MTYHVVDYYTSVKRMIKLPRCDTETLQDVLLSEKSKKTEPCASYVALWVTKRG